MERERKISIILLVVIAIVVAVSLFVLVPSVQYLARQQVQAARSEQLSAIEMKRLFADRLEDADEANQRVSLDNSTNSFAGPLAPVDCDNKQRVCIDDSNCSLLCIGAAEKTFVCDPYTSTCSSDTWRGIEEDSVKGDGNDKNGAGASPECNTKIGEYALLQGYNELGVAQWNCVQLYPTWNDTSRYCEGGKVDIDARVRAPSYLDCTCPSGTTRMVYSKSTLGNVVYGLPHCVTNTAIYSSDYKIV